MKEYVRLSILVAMFIFVFTSPSFAQTAAPTEICIEDFAPAWSPKGDKIAFLSNRDQCENNKDSFELFIANADGTGIKKMGGESAPHIVDFFCWSADGTKVAYLARIRGITTAKDERGKQLLIANIDGSKVFNASKDDFVPEDLAWAPDGSKLAFTAPNPKTGACEIWLLGTDAKRKLVDGCKPVWSPDSKSLYFSFSDNPAFQTCLGVINIADGSIKKYETVNERSSANPMSLQFLASVEYKSWSPDGTKIYAGDRSRLGSLNIAAGEKSWKRVIDLGNARIAADNMRMASKGGDDWTNWSQGLQNSISPDGKLVAFMDQGEIFTAECKPGDIFKAGGERGKDYCVNPKKLTKGPTDKKFSPSWSPDAKKITFVKNQEIWVIAADGTGETQISNARTKALTKASNKEKELVAQKETRDKTERSGIFSNK